MTHFPKKSHNLFLGHCLNRYQTKHLEHNSNIKEWFLFQHGLNVNNKNAKRRQVAHIHRRAGSRESPEHSEQEDEFLLRETLEASMLPGGIPFYQLNSLGCQSILYDIDDFC